VGQPETKRTSVRSTEGVSDRKPAIEASPKGQFRGYLVAIVDGRDAAWPGVRLANSGGVS
jgi:hypothetical protein